jgi:hypothetical protein
LTAASLDSLCRTQSVNLIALCTTKSMAVRNCPASPQIHKGCGRATAVEAASAAVRRAVAAEYELSAGESSNESGHDTFDATEYGVDSEHAGEDEFEDPAGEVEDKG